MAVIDPVPVISDNGSYVRIMKWTPLTEADSGSSIELPQLPDKTVQAYGTFGSGGAVTIYGSNNPADKAIEPSNASSSWTPLTDVDGLGNIVLNSTKGAQILENYRYIACEVTAGTGVSVTVQIVCERKQ